MSDVKSNGIDAPHEDATENPVQLARDHRARIEGPPPPPSSKALIDDDTPGDPSESKRYEITVERQIIIYAPDAEIAEQRALAYFGFRLKHGETVPCKVVEVKELPLLDKRGPIVEGPSGRPSSK